MDWILKKLAKTIVDRCFENDVLITNDFALFLISLYRLNPLYELREDDEDAAQYEKIVQAIVKKFIDPSSPCLAMMKMQLFVAKHYQKREETIEKHRLFLHRKTSSFVLEICNTDRVDTDRCVQKLYQKILVVITLLSGLGNPTIESVLREVSVALQSIFQPSELSRYVSLSKQEKEEQLMEMMCVVSGIRLFNRDCQRGGEGIDDLPKILREAVRKTHNAVLELLEQLMKKVFIFTAVIEKILSYSDRVEGDCDCEQDEYVKWIIEMLTACRQQEVYIRRLLNDVERCKEGIKNCVQRLENRLLKLHETLRYRTAIPTARVYPQFIDLTDIWMSLQDEVIVLSHINHFFWQIFNLSTQISNSHHQETLNEMVLHVEVLTDAERLENSMGKLITSCGDCQLYYPNSAKNFEKIKIELLGFCAWTFIAGKGALIPGNQNNGVVHWKEKYYTFSSPKAAENFGKNPDKYSYKIMDFIRNRVEYINLFQVSREIEHMKFEERLTDEGPQLKQRQNQEVQTDVHILPSYIDKDYTSSVWEIRRKALHLASISMCSTRSTQTVNSNFRCGVEIQAWPRKNRLVQTVKDSYTNTKSSNIYIHGLRGKTDKCHVLSLDY